MNASGAPLVTVLVTTYNHERFIEQALHSVAAQETSFPYEVVVIEDCSTDRTRALVEAFAEVHPDKVRLALAPTNENSNRIFLEQWAGSTSEYVALLDGDDYWTSPHKLQLQVDAMEARPEYALCFHDVNVLPEDMAYVWQGRFSEGYGDGTRIRTLARLGPVPPDGAQTVRAQRTIESAELWTGCFVPGCSPLLRRSLVPHLPDGLVDIEFGDWALYLLLAEHGFVLYLDAVLGVYRVHRGGVWSGLPRDVQHVHIVPFFERMLTLIPSQDPVIRAQIERHRALAANERRRAAAHDYIVTALMQPPAAETFHALSARVPPDAQVIWTHPVRPSALAGRLVPFLHAAPSAWETFAAGPSGSRDVSWIAPGFAYEFRLHDGDVSQGELAALTVVADRAAPGPPASGPSRADETASEAASLDAVPNPAVPAGTHAQTTVEWRTPSRVRVSMTSYPLQEALPADDLAAIEHLEELRERGGTFIVIPPPCARLLELYPELAMHLTTKYALVVEDAVTGRIYDLREPEMAQP
jgi:glycosyltransferase involved in cell wall biosynthesis